MAVKILERLAQIREKINIFLQISWRKGSRIKGVKWSTGYRKRFI